MAEPKIDNPCPKCGEELMVWTRPNGSFICCTECDFMESYGTET